jgi:hypothetical protein
VPFTCQRIAAAQSPKRREARADRALDQRQES